MISEVGKRAPAPKVVAWLNAQPEETLFLSVLTLGEAAKGLAKLDPADPQRVPLTNKWQAIEERFDTRILPVSEAIVRRWGSISGILTRGGGRQAPVVDTFLAATALELDLYLVTRNVSDVAGTGAAIFNPWDDNPANFPLAT